MREARFKLLTAIAVVGATLGLAVPSASAAIKPGHCNHRGVCTPPSNLLWSSARMIRNGVGANVSSKDVCPDVRPDGSPLQGTREVEVSVSFSFGGGIGEQFPVAADGSWSFKLKIHAPSTTDLHATLLASCVDVTVTGVDIADYRPHDIAVNP